MLLYTNENHSKEFLLKKLTLSLVKQHLEDRSNIFTPPNDVTIFILRYLLEQTRSKELQPRKKRERCVDKQKM